MSTEATKITLVEGAAPSTPAANRSVIYVKSDGLLYCKDDAGQERAATLGVWTSYTPTMTNLTLGSGTLVGRYKMLDAATCEFYVSLVWGAGTSLAGDIAISLPVTARTGGHQTANGFARDTGTTFFVVGCRIQSGATAMDVFCADGTGDRKVDATNPMTWTTNDELVVKGTVEV